jgi:hypothetical protein
MFCANLCGQMKSIQRLFAAGHARIFMVITCCLLITASFALNQRQVVKDVSSRIFYQQNSPAHLKRLSFLKLSAMDTSDYLMLSGKNKFSVFVNSRLWKSGIKILKINTDSLREMHVLPMVFTFVTDKSEILKLEEHAWESIPEFDPGLRVRDNKTEFIIIAIGLLLLIFSGVILTNTKNFLDYFRFVWLFDPTRRDENSTEFKIQATKNVFLYLLTGFYLSFIFTLYHFESRVGIKLGPYLVYWIITFFLVVLLLLGKILFVRILSWVYHFEMVFGQQIFGTLRLGILLCLISSIIFVFRFLTKTEQLIGMSYLPYLWLGFTLVFYLVLFLRLRLQLKATAFQIFSYLCVSEVIPLVFLINTIKP